MIKIISIDLQKDFTDPQGRAFRDRPSVSFIKNELVPFLREKDIKIYEIISDYRQPRQGDTGDLCYPGTFGYESEIPDDVKDANIWVKSMNSPEWIRKGRGDKDAVPELPYPDPESFTKWLIETVGTPVEKNKIVLIGLTLDCCVLSTAQDLTFRGYDVYVLSEAVDVYSGNQEEKEYLLKNVPVKNWADPMLFEEFKNEIA
ncbi:isochorismatase family protein [Candidatus Nomurabacteria bacterium]|nr:isochorismatase family protein [Candidatus Nomurabacteria bacterium]USN94603.1 MAG: isochorismatase family protein [Candidatus Nomurabacteria bacterium]